MKKEGKVAKQWSYFDQLIGSVRTPFCPTKGGGKVSFYKVSGAESQQERSLRDWWGWQGQTNVVADCSGFANISLVPI